MIIRPLQVKMDGEWQYVFAYQGENPKKLILTKDRMKALRGEGALGYFTKAYPHWEFRLEEKKSKPSTFKGYKRGKK